MFPLGQTPDGTSRSVYIAALRDGVVIVNNGANVTVNGESMDRQATRFPNKELVVSAAYGECQIGFIHPAKER